MSQEKPTLSRKTMLCKVIIHKLTISRKDKQVSRDVAIMYELSNEKRGAYRKTIIDPAALEQAELLAGRIRHFHIDNTRPWKDDGYRILSVDNYFDFHAGLNKLIAEYDDVADDITEQYPELKRQAKIDLNGLYKEEDYPESGAIRDKFGIEVSIIPLPCSNDFRTDLSNSAEKEIKAAMDQDHQNTIDSLNRESFKDLYDHVNRVLNQLENPKTNLRQDTIDNVVALLEKLPKLNPMRSDDLIHMENEVRSKLTQYSSNDCKRDGRIRRQTTIQASKLRDAIEGYL